jgi:hypothetical protein
MLNKYPSTLRCRHRERIRNVYYRDHNVRGTSFRHATTRYGYFYLRKQYNEGNYSFILIFLQTEGTANIKSSGALLDITHDPAFILKKHFGDWPLPPPSGKRKPTLLGTIDKTSL